ncbi:hypothetical protein AB0J52_00670 [Spirillospora sp. NPDC049652]
MDETTSTREASANGSSTATLALAETLAETMALLRAALSVPLSLEETGDLLEWLFDAMDQLLAVLGAVGDGLHSTYQATVATGDLWDDQGAGRVRARVYALDQAMVNLASCGDTIGGAHMLLGHAKDALAQIPPDSAVSALTAPSAGKGTPDE